MRVLITGAFGNLGLMCVNQALALGYDVRCFDINNKKTSTLAESYRGRAEVVLGDIRDAALVSVIVRGVDAIIHNAALLPPLTETNPELAYAINVNACKQLLAEAERQLTTPVFIFPSSVTVFGLKNATPLPRRADDQIEATDNYTRHKIEIENRLRESTLPWVIMRVGVSVDARTLSTDLKTFKKLLSVKPSNPLEYVHPKDVAYAMCRAASEQKAYRKVLLIGGGPACQITQQEFLSTAFNAAGLDLPQAAHGDTTFYTHWMDTKESQAILEFQRHDFAYYREEMWQRLKYVRYLLAPFRLILNPLLGFFVVRLSAPQ